MTLTLSLLSFLKGIIKTATSLRASVVFTVEGSKVKLMSMPLSHDLSYVASLYYTSSYYFTSHQLRLFTYNYNAENRC